MNTTNHSLLNGTLEKTQLPNGIRVVTERMPFLRSVALGVWVHAGSSNESLDNNGIAHFLEHMFFKGTTNRSAKEIAQSLESLGGGLNGSTGKEVSVYNAYILAEDLGVAVDVLADLIQNSTFTESDIELEKQVILAEMAHAQEDPEELVFDHFYKNLFPNHPLGYFIYGTELNIIRFCRSDLADFMQNNYTPQRMIFAAAGNVDHNHFVELVDKYFHSHSTTAEAQVQPVMMQAEPVTTLRVKGFQQAHICLGARTFGYHDPQKYSLALLDILLGGGMSSRLFQNIREKYGFTYSIFSFSDIMAETGVFGAYIACDKHRIAESIDLLKDEVKKIQDGDLSEEELEMIKSQVRGNLIIGLESNGRRMKKIGETEIYNAQHRSVSEIIDLIDAIQPVDVIQLAQTLFTETNTSITVLSP